MSASTFQTDALGGERLTKLAWATLFVLCGALFLDALDVSMMGVALPSIRASLHMTTSSLQWVVSAYVLGYGGFLLLGGRAADLLGRRRVFLIALGVFVVASMLGGVASDGTFLIITRFIKGMSAAFTAPAALSIITTTFPEGPARNKALSVFTATGATGFSLGLVVGGLLTEIGWRWDFLVPAPVALIVLLAGLRLVPREHRVARAASEIDIAGAIAMTASMLLLVFTLVEAPNVGWLSIRTLGSLLGFAVVLIAFVARERTAAAPLVRLGILRSGSLIRANLGAMSLFGGWIGFQFITTLYLQQLRGWSALDTGLAIFPAGLIVATISPRMGQLIGRFGVTKLIVTGMVAVTAAYLLFLPIGLHSSYAIGMLPTFVLAGIGFALTFGPLFVAGTAGVAPEEQGLAGGLLNTSFQFGGALVLAIATAVINANTSSAGSRQSILNGYHAALYVSVIAATVGILVTVVRARPARTLAPVLFERTEESLAEASEAA